MSTKSNGFSGRSAQGGFSLISMLFFAVLLGGAFLTAAKVLPSLVEYYGIIKISKRAANGGGTIQDVRQSFDKAGMVEDITSISGKDLEINKDGEKTTVKFAYVKEVRLVGPVSLLIRYSGGSQ